MQFRWPGNEVGYYRFMHIVGTGGHAPMADWRQQDLCEVADDKRRLWSLMEHALVSLGVLEKMQMNSECTDTFIRSRLFWIR